MKETKSVQVYPDNDAINRKIEVWGLFGWELLSNQRQQEKHGDMIETFVVLTFQREKSEPWYPEVSKLEKEYDSLCAEYSAIEAQAPKGLFGSVLSLFGGKKKQAEREEKLSAISKKLDEIAEKAEALVNGR